MTFDIIDISEEEASMLQVLQLKLLRTAQQKKDALYHALQGKLKEYANMLASGKVSSSSLYEAMEAELTEEYEYQVEVIREQLIFSMALRDPTNDDELGGGSGSGGQGSSGGDETGYAVDYELSYIERYIAVRDYYLTIPDPDERIALYGRDEVARRYLDSYYTHLYDYLNSLR